MVHLFVLDADPRSGTHDREPERTSERSRRGKNYALRRTRFFRDGPQLQLVEWEPRD